MRVSADYDLNNLDFAKDWLEHKSIHEWWYATGILNDEEGNLYSFQFTVTAPRLGLIKPWVLMLAVTDFRNEKHYYRQNFSLFRRAVTLDPEQITFKDLASAVRTPEGFCFSGRGGDFAFELQSAAQKPPVWHCDGGRLRMGTDEPQDTTFYYSYTRLRTRGTLTLGGRTFKVTGETWFDRQGGPFGILDFRTHWEWFSLRMDDGEELMLFSFPRDKAYNDGTWVKADGAAERVRGYALKPLGFVTVNGMKFSTGWELSVPGWKEGFYRITPIMDGQLNLAYFEQLCRVSNEAGERKGYCFAELLPGVYNEKVSKLGFFKKA